MKRIAVLAGFLASMLLVSCVMHSGSAMVKTTPLRLLTEDYPPITFQKDGEVTGLATDIVREILSREGTEGKIELLAWDEAYDTALKEPNVVLFSTTRTAKREKLFHWLGPIGSYNDALYAKKGSRLKINSLEDAKSSASIGTVDGWFSQEFLQENGFTNLISSEKPKTIAAKLMSGEVELAAFTDMTAPAILAEAGASMSDLKRVFVIKQYDFYIAFSLGTNEKIIQSWRKKFAEMKKDGSFAKILQKWIPGSATPE